MNDTQKLKLKLYSLYQKEKELVNQLNNCDGRDEEKITEEFFNVMDDIKKLEKILKAIE